MTLTMIDKIWLLAVCSCCPTKAEEMRNAGKTFKLVHSFNQVWVFYIIYMCVCIYKGLKYIYFVLFNKCLFYYFIYRDI